MNLFAAAASVNTIYALIVVLAAIAAYVFIRMHGARSKSMGTDSLELQKERETTLRMAFVLMVVVIALCLYVAMRMNVH